MREGFFFVWPCPFSCVQLTRSVVVTQIEPNTEPGSNPPKLVFTECAKGSRLGSGFFIASYSPPLYPIREQRERASRELDEDGDVDGGAPELDGVPLHLLQFLLGATSLFAAPASGGGS